MLVTLPQSLWLVFFSCLTSKTHMQGFTTCLHKLSSMSISSPPAAAPNRMKLSWISTVRRRQRNNVWQIWQLAFTGRRLDISHKDVLKGIMNFRVQNALSGLTSLVVAWHWNPISISDPSKHTLKRSSHMWQPPAKTLTHEKSAVIELTDFVAASLHIPMTQSLRPAFIKKQSQDILHSRHNFRS